MNVGLFTCNHNSKHSQNVAALLIATGHKIFWKNAGRFMNEPERDCQLILSLDGVKWDDIDYCHEANGIKTMLATEERYEKVKALFMPKEPSAPIATAGAAGAAVTAPASAPASKVPSVAQKAAAAIAQARADRGKPKAPKAAAKAPAPVVATAVTPASPARPPIVEAPPVKTTPEN